MKFIHLQNIIVLLCWFNFMLTALQGNLNFVFAVTCDGTNITDTVASSGHFPNQFICLGMTAFVSEMMVANETPCAIFASITLFLIVIKAIFLDIVSFSARTINGNLCVHNSNIPCSRCFLFGIFFIAPFSGHYQIKIGQDDIDCHVHPVNLKLATQEYC